MLVDWSSMSCERFAKVMCLTVSQWTQTTVECIFWRNGISLRRHDVAYFKILSGCTVPHVFLLIRFEHDLPVISDNGGPVPQNYCNVLDCERPRNAIMKTATIFLAIFSIPKRNYWIQLLSIIAKSNSFSLNLVNFTSFNLNILKSFSTILNTWEWTRRLYYTSNSIN